MPHCGPRQIFDFPSSIGVPFIGLTAREAREVTCYVGLLAILGQRSLSRVRPIAEFSVFAVVAWPKMAKDGPQAQVTESPRGPALDAADQLPR